MEDSFTQLVQSGYTVRPARMDDLPEAVPMFNAAEAETTGNAGYTVERYAGEWRETGINLDTQTRLVRAPGGQVVGCVEVWDHFNPPARPWIWGRVHPDWQGHGVGSAMLEWAVKTSRRVLDRLPADARLAPHVAAPSHHRPSIELFESMGFCPCRYSWTMLIDLEGTLPEPRAPQGFHIRAMHYPEDLEETYRVQNDAFSEHWGFVQRTFEEGFAEWKSYVFEARKCKPDDWLLAMQGDRIAGVVNPIEHYDLNPDLGWIDTLGVLKSYRRHGLGQALLEHSFYKLQQKGVQRIGLGVDAKNKTGATRLYERVGMHVDQEFIDFEIELRPGRELAVMD